MERFESLLLMMFVSICLAVVIILKRESIPQQLRRPLAIIALFMVGSSFIMFVAALFTSGIQE